MGPVFLMLIQLVPNCQGRDRADTCTTMTKINNQFFINFQTGSILHFSYIIIYIYIHIKCRSNPMRGLVNVRIVKCTRRLTTQGNDD